jgi:hypothetical protein
MSNNDPNNGRRQGRRPRRTNPDVAAAIGAVILAGAMCLMGGAQIMTLDTPSDLEHARIKAEKAWKAWEAQGHIEPKLLSMPAERALSEIRKDSKLAEQYLAAREVQVKLLSDDFKRRATALESASAGLPDLTKLQKSEEASLSALMEGDVKATAEIARFDQEGDPGQREAKRQAAQKESGYYKELADEIRKRIEVLQTSARSDEQYAANEHALIDTLNRLSATLDEQSEAIARERDDWQSYHKHLEEVVEARSHGSVSSSALSGTDDETGKTKSK